jgi:hypothetical protein
VREVHKLVHVYVDGEEINTTDTYPFWVEGKGWIEADELKAGDVLRLYTGELKAVEKVEIEVFDRPVKVYNFEVEDWHTYYVTEQGVLVHNAKDCGGNGNASSGNRETSNVDKTKHGQERAQQRGFSDEKINNIKQNYSHKVYQSGGRTVYAKKNGNYYDVVITNSEGEIMSTVGENTKSLRNWGDVVKMLNNNGGFSSLPVD